MPFFGDRWLTASYYGGTNLCRDVPVLADLYLQGKLELDAQLARRYPLEDINRALGDLDAGEAGRGVIVF
jgi:S-(hydroxymethyl)glutathione dehydrogenase/alcohol dehydrogenase